LVLLLLLLLPLLLLLLPLLLLLLLLYCLESCGNLFCTEQYWCMLRGRLQLRRRRRGARNDCGVGLLLRLRLPRQSRRHRLHRQGRGSQKGRRW
jgi:hypothetical protein